MALEIITGFGYSHPNTGAQSNLLAAHNKNRIRVQRKDFEIGQQQDDGTGLTLLKLMAPAPTVTIGGKLYSNVSNGAAYTGVFTIVSQPAPDQIVINEPFVGDFGNGWLNLNTDYKRYYVRARMSYEKADGSTGSLGEARFTPFTNGIFEADFSTYAKQIVSASDFDGNFYNIAANRAWGEQTASAIFKFTLAENYNGEEQPQGDMISYQPVNAAMDYTHKGGSNIWECYALGTGVTAYPVRFFRKPGAALRLWKTGNGELGNIAGNNTINGAPALTFHPLSLPGAITLEVKRYRAGNLLGTFYKAIALPNGNPAMPGYNGGDDRFLRAINLQFSATDLGSGVLEADGLEFTIVDNATKAIKHSETVTARVSNCIPRNPVLLKALNGYGGYEFFVFGVTQTKNVITKNGGVFTRNSEDFQQIEADELLLGKSADTEWIMGADDIYTDELYIIETILTSPVVWMRTPPAGFPNAPWEWAQVKIAPGTFLTQTTKANKHRIEFKVQPVSLNIQTT